MALLLIFMQLFVYLCVCMFVLLMLEEAEFQLRFHHPQPLSCLNLHFIVLVFWHVRFVTWYHGGSNTGSWYPQRVRAIIYSPLAWLEIHRNQVSLVMNALRWADVLWPKVLVHLGASWWGAYGSWSCIRGTMHGTVPPALPTVSLSVCYHNSWCWSFQGPGDFVDHSHPINLDYVPVASWNRFQGSQFL